MNKRRARNAVSAWALFVLAIAANLEAQQQLESGVFVLSGQIISQRGDFQDPFKVELYRDSFMPLAEYVVRPQEHFVFAGLSGGVYFVAADVPGFKRIRERFDLNGQRRTTFSIFLEEQEIVAAEPLHLAGREDLVVDVADFADRPPELTEGLQEAAENLGKGNIESARQRLEEVVGRDPDFYDAHMLLGSAYQRLLRYPDAEVQFKIAANLRSGLSAPWTSLGSLYLQAAKRSKAQEATAVRRILNDALGSLLRATDLNPNAAFAHYLLGVAYLEAGFYEDAEDSLLRSTQLEPRLSTARLALANVYIRLQEWPAALSQIDSYLEGNPGSPGVCDIDATRSQIAEILEAERSGNSSTGASSAPADAACDAPDTLPDRQSAAAGETR